MKKLHLIIEKEKAYTNVDAIMEWLESANCPVCVERLVNYKHGDIEIILSSDSENFDEMVSNFKSWLFDD